MQMQVYVRSQSHQPDSDSVDSSGPHSQPEAKQDQSQRLRPQFEDGVSINMPPGVQDGTASKKCSTCKKILIVILILLSVQAVSAAVIICVVPKLVDHQLLQVYLKLNSNQTQPTALKLTASSTPTHQVQMVKFTLDTDSAPKCISCSAGCKKNYPCWKNTKYMTNGSVGKLSMSASYGDIPQWSLTSDGTQIQVRQCGLFEIEAEMKVKIERGTPAGISGGIYVRGSLLLLCRETRPMSSTTELLLTCKVEKKEVALHVGDIISMRINSHQSSVQIQVESTYISLVRL